MRQVVITRHGGPEVLQLRDMPDPEPGPGEVRIKVVASGVNFADVLARLGLYPDAPKPPVVVGYEVSGHIDAIGPGPARHELGQAVVAVTKFKGYSDRVVVPAESAFPLPPRITLIEAAAIPVNYLTAYLALYRMANVRAGETVLVIGAGGGVGIAATQLAQLRKAVVIGTASASKLNALRALGVDHAVDRTANVAEAVARITEGRGVDIVLDPVGGPGLRASYGMLADMGRLVIYGASSLVSGERRSLVHVLRTLWRTPKFGAVSLLNHNRGVFGLNLGHLWKERKLLAAAMETLSADFGSGRLKPLVAKAFPLEQAADAHRFLESRSNIGKVVLTM